MADFAPPNVGAILKGLDREEYYKPSTAMARLEIGEKQLKKLIERGDIRSRPTAEVLDPAERHRRGRLPLELVAVVDVERLHRDLLERIGAAEDLRSAQAATSLLRQRLDEANETNASLRQTVAALEEVVRDSLVVAGAQLDQIRHLLPVRDQP